MPIGMAIGHWLSEGQPTITVVVSVNQTEKLRPNQLGKQKTPGLLAADLRPLLPGLGLIRIPFIERIH